MFRMNLGVWRHNDFVRRTFDPSDLDDLERATWPPSNPAEPPSAPLEWGLRRVVMDRIDP